MKNMLRTEKTRKLDYCSSLQKEIKPHMRKIVVDWMLEVNRKGLNEKERERARERARVCERKRERYKGRVCE